MVLYHILVELEFGVLIFQEGGKPENPDKNPHSKAGTNNKLNPLSHIGGRRALPPLRHPCSLDDNILCVRLVDFQKSPLP